MSSDQQIIGKKLGQYVVMSHIARGGMADMYLVRDVNLDREVALKVLLPEFTTGERFVKRFRKEAKAVATTTRQGPQNSSSRFFPFDNDDILMNDDCLTASQNSVVHLV